MQMLRLGLAGVLLALSGCGESTPVPVCDPPCPARTHCAPSGCQADDATAVVDLSTLSDAAADCPSPCAAPVPYCGPNHLCVPCLVDGQCPVGMVCKPSGLVTACLPGCSDDARCGGGTMKCCHGACTDSAKDGQNCGACGTACMTPNAGSACVNGHCTAGSCRAGWGDCNADPADGCETNLRVTPTDCGACGQSCAPPHGIGACSGGCYLAACDYGFDDCNAEFKDGCEVAISSDTRNCGGCANVCAAVARAQVTCSLGACLIQSCSNGYGDCNKTFADGCEVTLSTNASHCGACGAACGQGLVCAGGDCTCPPCSFPNAVAACVAKQCAIASCKQGFDDCDGKLANGCEQNIGTDKNNCGACGKVCAQGLVCSNGGCTCPQCNIPNAKPACVNNLCVLDSCLPGYGDCDKNAQDGCEVDLNNDGNNCGACAVACPKEKSICDRGACTSIPAPIIYFDAADPNSYPGNGKTWFDLAGSGVQGTMINNITFGTITNVKTLIFDGAGAGVNFPNAILDEKSFGAIYWVYSKVPQQVADQGGLYVNWTSRNVNPPNWVSFFRWSVDDWYFRVNNGNCCQDLPGSGTGGFAKNIPPNQWTMVHFFYQIGTVNGWKWGSNGKNVAVGTIASRAAGQSEPTSVIGWGAAGQGGYWNGGISSVRFYRVLLTDDQLASMFAVTKGAYGL